MTSVRKFLPLVAFSAAILAAGFAHAEKKAQPLNAGQDGTKSNAGGGNGTENQVGETTVTTATIVTSYTYDAVTTSEPVVVSVTTTTEEVGRVLVSSRVIGCGNQNQVCNLQSIYSVTYNVTTTTGSETTTTTQTMLVTETTTKTTSTTDIYDIDPGHSQDVNQAPEGEPADIVVVEISEPVVTEEPLGDPAVVVDTTYESEVTGTTTGLVRETTPCNNAQCT